MSSKTRTDENMKQQVEDSHHVVQDGGQPVPAETDQLMQTKQEESLENGGFTSQNCIHSTEGNKIPPPPYLGSCRLILTIMCFFGTYHLMALRFNLSMALVCMSSDPTETYSKNGSTFLQENNIMEPGFQGKCPKEIFEEDSYAVDNFESSREFSLSKHLQGWILSSFFYGYILTQVAGGYVSDRFGARNVLLAGMAGLSVTTLFIPVIARIHPHLLILVRIIQGLASGFAFPSIYNIFTKWVHPDERATLMSISFAGIPTATVTIYPLVSGLCTTDIDRGWPLAFYIPGATGCLWCILFHCLIYGSPQDHPKISSEELQYLTQEKTKSDATAISTPWKQLLRSKAVWSLTVTHFCSAFGYYLVVINISLFIRETLGFPVQYNGLLSMLPTLGMLVFSCTGKLFDLLKARTNLSLQALRKIFNSIAFFVPAVCFLSLFLFDCSQKIVVVSLIILAMSIHELAMTGGFYFSHKDIAGPHSGVVFGITNTFAQIPGFLTPTLVSYMTEEGTLIRWCSVFFLSGSILIIGGLVYLVLATTNLEPWASEKKDNTPEKAIT